MDDYDVTRLVERRDHVTCEDFLSLDQVAQFLRALVVQVQTGLLVSFNDSSVRHDLLHRFDPVLDDFRLHALRSDQCTTGTVPFAVVTDFTKRRSIREFLP